MKCIGKNAFKFNKTIKKVVLNEELETISELAFVGCSNLRTINIRTTLKQIGPLAFGGCYSLSSSITIPEGIKEIPDGTFRSCQRLSDITLPSGLKRI